MTNKKLIEVALPLEVINIESAREKSLRHGHPSTLHLWWARRPLAAARAVIWSSLIDDPSSHPELFPTEEAQNIERQRLFRILEDLVVWENSNNKDVLNAAKTEILRSTNGNPPSLLDPFSGGGTIPLEAQRLGLKSYAHDLNPVAVTIEKAMIEIPYRFHGLTPIRPDKRGLFSTDVWTRAIGLSQDIDYYGTKLKEIAFSKLKMHYPLVNVPEKQGGGKATVIAWVWARTVKCTNPNCNCEMPLIRSVILSKVKGNEAYVDIDSTDRILKYVVKYGTTSKKGTVTRSGVICPRCNQPAELDYVREEGKKGRLGSQMIAVIAEGNNKKLFITPDDEQVEASKANRPEDMFMGKLSKYPGYINPLAYGYEDIDSLFSDRQLLSLKALCDSVKECRDIIRKDAVLAGMEDDDISLKDGGKGAKAYSEALAVYLSFIVDKIADYNATTCTWNVNQGGIAHTFSNTGIGMTWDYSETNIFSNSSGCLDNMTQWVVKSVAELPASGESEAKQYDAQREYELKNVMISTDPPYYSNVPYSDFADYFYGFLRKNLKEIYPDLFGTILTPKSEELVADPYRANGKEEAYSFFENGMLEACKRMNESCTNDIPVTIYYAFKQVETNSKGDTVSSGWETMLSAIIRAGFTITGTWPMRTERVNRPRGIGSNALASSIVLVCRKRDVNAPQITRRNLINVMRAEIKPALKKLQSSNIAPVDLSQSAIGPGMAVFSRYSKVLEADGSEMSVRSALQVINEELDLYFNEQVGDLDAMSRFCVDLYTQSAFNDIQFGQADVLARAKGTSVDAIASHGPVYAKGGQVHLIDRDQLSDKIDHNENCIWMFAQQLTHLMGTGGIDACAKAIYDMIGSNAEKAKDLAYRLYTIAEQKKWANEAYAYNALVVAWPDIQARAAELRAERPEQMNLFDY